MSMPIITFFVATYDRMTIVHHVSLYLGKNTIDSRGRTGVEMDGETPHMLGVDRPHQIVRGDAERLRSLFPRSLSVVAV